MRRSISLSYVVLLLLSCAGSLCSSARGQATYAGLATATGHDDHSHTGFAVVQTNATGGFTAQIQWQGFPYRVAGSFDDSGVFRTTLRKRHGSLEIEIHTSVNGVVAGSITDGTIVSQFAANVAGNGDPVPRPRYNGICGDTGVLGFLTHSMVGVSVRGVRARLVGKLNDGTPFAAGTWVIPGYSIQYAAELLPAVRLPIYLGIYGTSTRGSVWGYVSIYIPPRAEGTWQHFAGTAQWYRPAQPRGPAPNATGQTELHLYGATYEPGPEFLKPENEPGVPEARLFLRPSGEQNFTTVPLEINGRFLSVVGENSLDVRIRTFPQTGFFTGSFTNWLTGKRAHFTGLVLGGGTAAIGNWEDRSGLGYLELLGDD